MAFPFTIKNTVRSHFFSKIADQFDEKNLVETLLRKFSHFNFFDLEQAENSFSFTTRYSLISFGYRLIVNIRKSDVFSIQYEFQTTKLLTVTFFVILFAALVSNYSVYNFLLFSAIFAFIFYAANIYFIIFSVNKAIKSIPLFGSADKIYSDEISEKQKEWIEDPDSCPACGNQINDFDTKCPECGLKLEKRKRYFKPLDTTDKSKTIRYIYKSS